MNDVASMRHVPITGPAPKSPDWYALRIYNPDRDRPVVFGASEAAAACNLSPYSSALQVFLEKRGQVPQWVPDAETQERLEFGSRIESVIIDAYSDREGCTVDRDHPMYFHPDHPFMAATPDGIAYSSLENKWGVEAKNSGSRMFDSTGTSDTKYGVEGTDQVPVVYLVQSHQQMAVMGLDRVDFPVLKDGNKLMVYKVDRNEDLIQQIISAEKELYERIIANDPPEPNFQHSGTIKVLHRMFGHNPGTVAQLSEIQYDMWLKYEQLGVSIKMMEEDREEIRAKIMWALGECEIGRFPDAGFEVRRTIVKDSIVTQKDVDDLLAKIGQVKRAGHSRIMRKSLNK